MQIDSLTLMVPGAFLSGVTGIFLIGAWLYFKRVSALLFWSSSALMSAAGMTVLIAGLAVQDTLLIAAGVGVSTLAPGLVWGGARHFGGHKAHPALLLAGPAAWLLAGAISDDPQKWTTLVSFATWYVYLPAAIWELWKGRGERLHARWPLMGLFALHGLVFVGGTSDVLTGTLVLGEAPSLLSWFGFIHFESLVYSMGGAVSMILLCQQRVENNYRDAAGVDALTGVANRRAFIERAERLHRRCGDTGAPLTVIMFDLDRFKSINDSLGHEGGDRILCDFARTAEGLLRPNDTFGRYGGEEFVLVLPNASVETGYVIADRIRHTFAEDHKFIGGSPISATVSAGVAQSDPAEPLERSIAAADQAMYAAKTGGRNRVCYAPTQTVTGSQPRVVRIA